MTIKNARVKAWSFSRLSTHDICPAKLGYALKGLKEPESPAMLNGQRVHKIGEDYLVSKVKRVPKEYENFATDLRRMRKQGYRAEEMWCLTRGWEEAPAYGQPRHFEETWLRVKVDAFGFPADGALEIVDYKTGKVNAERDAEQLKLYGTAGLSLWDVETVRTRLMYLDVGRVPGDEAEFHVSELDELQSYWEVRAAKMLKDGRFSPRPGFYCRWCAYSKANNGPCRY